MSGYKHYLPPQMYNNSRIRARFRALGAVLSDRGQALIRLIAAWGVDESTLLIGFAVAIGATVGVAVIIFYRLIDLAQNAALTAADGIPGIGRFSIVVVVVLGLGIARLIVKYGAADSDGGNIPDVTRAVVKEGGTVHSVPILAKTAAAAVAMGAGGSVGAEGPVAVAGAALGSRIGRFFRSSPGRLRVLVACGAAAGISAAFNAPIAGVFFSLEKVLGTFAVSAFPPILVASVIAAAVSRAAFGNSPVIEIPEVYGIGASSELILYAVLGVLTGMVAVLYSRSVNGTPDVMAKITKPWGQVALAALGVAVLNIVFRADLWGRGHETLDLSIIGNRDALFLVGLAFAKLVATSLTVSATRAGGVFTPALFIGATLGGGFALLITPYLPGFTIIPEAFALVGMTGLVAGSTHAPLTAIMIVFEMTNDYDLILPLMLTGAIAYITAKRLHPHSIYSAWLAKRGEYITHGRDTALMERLPVQQCYNRNPHVIGESATLTQILSAIQTSSQTEFPVVDSDLRFIGMITYNDLRHVVSEADSLGDVLMAGDLANPDVETVTPKDSLRVASQRLGIRGAHQLPVVDETDSAKLLGLVSREEIFATYDRALLTESDL
ncbi:MAG: chloride channel protein [Gemmatimonadota bacterium]|nr:chloride channel protein [Gemmatimonadota bacterium]